METIITVDFHYERVVVSNSNNESYDYPFKEIDKDIVTFLSELLNTINKEGVKLQWIDDGVMRVVNEW